MTAELTPTTCQVDVSDGGRWPHFHKCGRPVVGTVKAFGRETPACSLHVKVEARRQAKSEAFNRTLDESNQARQAATELADQLRAYCVRLGVDPAGIQPHFQASYGSKPGRYTGAVVVPPEVLQRLLS